MLENNSTYRRILQNHFLTLSNNILKSFYYIPKQVFDCRVQEVKYISPISTYYFSIVWFAFNQGKNGGKSSKLNLETCLGSHLHL
jgi:hypothetical protein